MIKINAAIDSGTDSAGIALHNRQSQLVVTRSSKLSPLTVAVKVSMLLSLSIRRPGFETTVYWIHINIGVTVSSRHKAHAVFPDRTPSAAAAPSA
jgi:hypothetical protein